MQPFVRETLHFVAEIKGCVQEAAAQEDRRACLALRESEPFSLLRISLRGRLARSTSSATAAVSEEQLQASEVR